MTKGLSIGILGGGQLGRMLWQASVRLSPYLQPSHVFHESKVCPAGRAGANVVEGSVHDVEKLSKFFRRSDTFAIENEFLPLDAIESAWTRAGKSASMPRPSHQSLAIAQDKLEQKKLFLNRGFLTSDFVEVTAEWLDQDCEKIAALHRKWQGLVLKKSRMGYDGKGNLALPPQANNTLDRAGISSFCREAFAKDSRVYAEQFVPFVREVALVSVRSHQGDFGHYPLIETVQSNGVCLLAYTALHSKELQNQAQQIARDLGESLGLLGTYAVEFFVKETGELLVNEMAPRVHNSGHFTQAASRCSQFEMHLKSYYVDVFDPKDFECAPAFAMINLLGPPEVHGDIQAPLLAKVYWYDKERTSPGRKLGHIIAQSSHEKDLPVLIDELKLSEKRWRESAIQRMKSNK